MPDVDNRTAVVSDDANFSSNLERVLADRRKAALAPVPQAQPEKIPPKVFGIMAMTTALTFATLMTGYQLVFPPHQLFA